MTSFDAYFLVTCVCLLVSATAHSELYVQAKSVSPDGKVVFAINYPPTQKHPEGYAQGCFLRLKSGTPIGEFFFLEDSDADSDHPGTYSFDNYHVFDYVWSADSTHVAVTLNRRRWSRIYPFRRQKSGFEMLEMPGLFPLLETHLKGAIQIGLNTDTKAKRWTKHHGLIAAIAKDVQITQSGDLAQDWKERSLEAIVFFAPNGKPTVEATEFHADH